MAVYAPSLSGVRERKASTSIGEFEVPPYALRSVELPPRMPKDDLGREIVLLLALHPQIESPHRDSDLAGMSQSEKVALFASLKELLGIKPTRTRRLGFLGND